MHPKIPKMCNIQFGLLSWVAHKRNQNYDRSRNTTDVARHTKRNSNWSRGLGDAAGRNKGQHTGMQVKKNNLRKFLESHLKINRKRQG